MVPGAVHQAGGAQRQLQRAQDGQGGAGKGAHAHKVRGKTEVPGRQRLNKLICLTQLTKNATQTLGVIFMGVAVTI